MKFFTFTLVLFFAFLATVSLAGNFEFQAKNVSDPGVWKYTSTVGFGEQFSPTFGWTGFVLASNTWGEAYVGPTFKPATWVTLLRFALVSRTARRCPALRLGTTYTKAISPSSTSWKMEMGAGTSCWPPTTSDRPRSSTGTRIVSVAALGSKSRVRNGQLPTWV